jgi:hypothetical protein
VGIPQGARITLEESMSTKPTITLTRAAANRLAQLAAMPGLLNDAANLYRVGEVAETHLTELAQPPVQPAREAPAADWIAWDKSAKAWGREELPAIEVTERKRDALRALVKAAIEKGQFSGSAADTALQRALGLQPED